MDPISALGLAANIAQFVDMGIAIVRNTKEIAGAGATISTLHLASLARDIKNVSSSLTWKCRESQLNTLSQEEKDLCELAIRCTKTANELKECLDRITVRSDNTNTWRSVLAAVQTACSAERIDIMTKQLSDYRNQLSLRVLLVLNQRARGQQDTLSALRDEIVEAITVTYQDLKAAIGEQHSETATAILTTRGGGTTAITNPGAESRFSERLASGKATETSVTYSSQLNASQEKQYIPMMVHGIGDYKAKILDSLHFRGITERFSAIPSAHMNTFEWIWREPAGDPDIVKWDSLSQWFQASTEFTRGCYWLSGKAGSGKSSLMKYLQNDRRTLDNLKRWAGSAGLVTPSFYLWYAGTPLQKSHTGLLRGLLFDILSSRPELIATVFPDLCRAIISKSFVSNIDPTYVELKTAFAKLVQHLPADLRICFFVDGIDEYTGDHNDICDFFREVARHPSIKALLSSRPIPACVHQFEGYPKLRLQDLTRKDIELYLRDHLGTHSLMVRMNEVEPGITVSLISKILDRALGVFLWVHLVVRNLCSRLQDYDTAANLMDEVDKLPSDLEKLYDHMLEGMSEQNRVYGSKVLQAMLRHFKLGGASTMTVIQLSFVEDDDYEKCLATPIEALEKRARNWRCEATEGRLRSRCCGLIEVDIVTPASGYVSMGNLVRFFHRTVIEFLETEEVWKKLCLLTSKTLFNAELALMSSSISELKVIPPKPRLCAEIGIEKMLSYEKNLSLNGKEAFHNIYLPGTIDVLSHHWHNEYLFKSPDEQINVANSSCSRGCKKMGLKYPDSFLLSVSLRFRNRYLFQCIEQLLSSGFELEEALASLVFHFVEEKELKLRITLSKNIELLSEYLHESDIPYPHSLERLQGNRWKNAVKGKARGWSLQEFILHHCFSIMDNTEDEGFDFTNEIMVQSLLRVLLAVLLSRLSPRNAVITVAIRPQGNMGKRILSFDELSVVRLLLQKMWSTLCRVPNAELGETAEMMCELERELKSKPREAGQGGPNTGIASFINYIGGCWGIRPARRTSHNREDPKHSGHGITVAELGSKKCYIPRLILEEELPQAGVESPWFSYESAHTETYR